ncbi:MULTISPECIES: glycosyltransferase [Dethiosulfovibrio]|uniref:Glycosyltransferase n=2 Tax=Dethiosulfovibrio TaxID=47054 RepID=A0ABS9EKC9_9BACT|nr:MULTISPECIES: glycosyltransferase [Dethiosulfovibrio]MCF4113921.1 glycosyltransferase [Dethiosulfovibrio russensis]MCF4141666.1 glycosyltransferase [Dethiosulfovibrio marinus]MCF4143917.1 glycosyltransferase [Dethiosulfovibrio acidaminovorans]
MGYKILFCSDSLIIDGVTSYVLHVGTALSRAGHHVAVLGRWAGKGFQGRYREEGIKVIQCPSLTVGNRWFDKKAREFDPDVIMTDSRRSFPLATRLKRILDRPVVTYFLDHLEKTDKPGRDVPSLVKWSDAWAGAEEPILQTLPQHSSGIPIMKLPRPLDKAVRATPLPPKDPFVTTCFGRLSGYKTPGMIYLMEHMEELKKAIPSASITVVGGGGWRLLKFRRMAAAINRKIGEQCVNVVGTKPDPRPWIDRSNAVCAASTSAIESVLSQRPTVCLTSYWMGHATPENLDQVVGSYFGERGGIGHFKKDPSLLKRIIPTLAEIYRSYGTDRSFEDLITIRERLSPKFSSRETVDCFEEIMKLFRT